MADLMFIELETRLRDFTDRPYENLGKSLYALAVIESLFPELQTSAFGQMLDEFIEKHHRQLESLFAEYEKTTSHEAALLSRPESLAIFIALDRAICTLKILWLGRLPSDDLQRYERMWAAVSNSLSDADKL